MSSILWKASDEAIEKSRLYAYQRWLEENKKIRFSSYADLWEWSVNDRAAFWESIYQYFEVIDHGSYTSVISGSEMPYVRWFSGSRLNYAEHIFRQSTSEYPAILYRTEHGDKGEVSWKELEDSVGSLREWMLAQGMRMGDRVAAVLPNVKEATIAFLATNAIGAVWSSCSPDFGTDSLLDRFQQIEPKMLFVCDGYFYNGKRYDKSALIHELMDNLPSVERIIVLPFNGMDHTGRDQQNIILWDECFKRRGDLVFEAVPFEHPIWILFSSGTTGIPKAITHSHGGVLLEHLKYLALQQDVHRGERFFWYSTTGWMMWNFVQASLLVGATIVLYEGSPTYPDIEVMWRFAQETSINHFGTSAAFLTACMKRGLSPKEQYDLSSIRTIGSTGSPLPEDAFDWCYRHVKEDLWLCSMSGGTDVCTAFVGSAITEPVRRGRIQVRALGAAIYAYDEEGQKIYDEEGEMVITQPMPSMPIYFWNDEEYRRYLSSYFDLYPGVWRHGDWVEIAEDGSLRILGRSDATLNRYGVRIGTAEIYRTIDQVKEVQDSLIVNIEYNDGSHYMPLFVQMKEGYELNEYVKSTINTQLRTMCSPRHVPDQIIEVSEIPYTISGKKLETPIKKILMGKSIDKVVNPDALRNPTALQFFIEEAKKN